MKCPHCGAVITIERRSRPQSNLLHKAIRSYCDATGEPFDLIKIKWKFHIGAYVTVPVDPDKLREWKPPEWEGAFVATSEAVVYRGRAIPAIVFVKSEAAFTREEEARVIDHAIEECQRVDADLGWVES